MCSANIPQKKLVCTPCCTPMIMLLMGARSWAFPILLRTNVGMAWGLVQECEPMPLLCVFFGEVKRTLWAGCKVLDQGHGYLCLAVWNWSICWSAWWWVLCKRREVPESMCVQRDRLWCAVSAWPNIQWLARQKIINANSCDACPIYLFYISGWVPLWRLLSRIRPLRCRTVYMSQAGSVCVWSLIVWFFRVCTEYDWQAVFLK